MNQDFFLFIFALLLAFATGNISYLIKENQEFKLTDIKEINDINLDLQKNYLPFVRLDLNSEYPTNEHLKLLENTQKLSPPKKDIILNSSTCFKNKLHQLSTNFLEKDSVWLNYLCNQIDRLPEDFFRTPPYLHPNGKSYAYMFYNINKYEKNIENWHFINRKYMHINELKKTTWPINEEFRFLYNLSQNEIDEIIEGNKIILTKHFYLIRTGNLKYFVLSADKARKNFRRAGYLLSQDEKGCFIKAGSVCWKKKSQSIFSYMFETSSIIFIVTLIILFLTARALYLRVSRQKKEEERKKHALRVLTHELRTPVSSLLLQVESLGQKATGLPDEINSDIAKIESEIYRLKHLAEKSKSYLQTDSSDIVHIELSEFNLFEFFSEIEEEYTNNSLKIKGPTELLVISDRYWLKMCVSNLIENAIRYGTEPIEILFQENNGIEINVSDQGSTHFTSLKQIMSTKHEQTKGLGIGLLIVEKTLKALEGSLQFSPQPTTFTIKLKKRKL